MTAQAARLQARRRTAEVELIVKTTLKMLGLDNVMLSERECKRRFGVWFSRAVEAGKLVGVRNGNRVEYSIQRILALQESELQRAEEQAEDFIV